MSNISDYNDKGFFTIRNFFTKKHMSKVRESLNKIADKSYSDMIHPHEKSKEVKKLILDKDLKIHELEMRLNNYEDKVLDLEKKLKEYSKK